MSTDEDAAAVPRVQPPRTFDLLAWKALIEARLGLNHVVAPVTTADNLSPVEPAPQAQQGVTVEELAYILSEAPSGDLGAAYWLLKHHRIGPLLRGEGAPAPVRVVLPEEPSDGPALYALNRTRDRGCFRAGWVAPRAEVERQQGGQADG